MEEEIIAVEPFHVQVQNCHSTYFSSSIASKPGRQSQIAKVGRGPLTVTSPQILGKPLQPEEVVQNWVYPAHRSNSIMHVGIEQGAWQRANFSGRQVSQESQPGNTSARRCSFPVGYSFPWRKRDLDVEVKWRLPFIKSLL